ncbi:MAG: hypothetical protein NTY69_00145 [Methylococcales bacterium]|nr:hypothetical protein [Methylococcales bacterium]
MDDADRVNNNQSLIDKANAHKSKRITTSYVATGLCLFCDEPVDPGRRWCDAQCRDDWQSENEED